MRLPASTQSARPVPPVRDESARAPKHPDTSQRKGLASSHFRRGFPRSPYSGIGSARWPPRRSSLDPPPADPAPAGILDVGGQLPEFGCALWGSGGQLVNRDSPYFPLRNALFDLPPYRGKWPEIWIGAHGPRMLRAAGRYGEGLRATAGS